MTIWQFLEQCKWADLDDRRAIIEHLAAFRMRKTLGLLDHLADAHQPIATSAGTSKTTSGPTACPTSRATAGVIVIGWLSDRA